MTDLQPHREVEGSSVTEQRLEAARIWLKFEVEYRWSLEDKYSVGCRYPELDWSFIGRDSKVACLMMSDEEWEVLVLTGEPTPRTWPTSRVREWLTERGIDPASDDHPVYGRLSEWWWDQEQSIARMGSE